MLKNFAKLEGTYDMVWILTGIAHLDTSNKYLDIYKSEVSFLYHFFMKYILLLRGGDLFTWMRLRTSPEISFISSASLRVLIARAIRED